ncbi:MAG: hypothetical protein PHC97_02540 [Patescibacteria group bacterium]|nr:hypothetical protein [Patescibacteria group bacterium]
MNKEKLNPLQPSTEERSRKKIEEDLKIKSEGDYVDESVDYALSTGWVKKEEKELFIKKYLAPIYKQYLEILEDLKKEKMSETEMKEIIRKLNYCLEATRRIGSTDPSNIMMTIRDILKGSKSSAQEYALRWFYEEAAKIINS